VVVEAVVDGCRDATYRPLSMTGQEVGHLRMAMIGMLPGQQANQTKEAIAEQVTSQRRCPAGVASIETPGEVGKDLEPGCSQGNLFNL